MLSSSDDEDDPVVKEIDIYLAKGLAEKLFLFQYPVRPSSASYDLTPHLGARIKPIQQKVELELGIDTNSFTYCYSRGEQIAHAVDRDDLQGSRDQKQHFPTNVMDRHILSSVKATEDSSKYAAAIYSNNSIHISPMKAIFQLHPSFNYFDKAEQNQKKAAATLGNDGQSEEEEDPKLVQLRFSKPQNQKKKEIVTKQVPMDENWVETKFFHCTDRRSVMERNLLLCHQDDFESPEFTVTSRDYLQILSPSEQQGTESPADLPHGVLSLLKLKGMSLTDQIKALLITAKVLQFTQLCTLLGGGMDTSSVLSGLSQYAMLVQGCWVVKSEILYPEGTKSHVSGLDAAKLWPSRDYVMFCFNKKRVLSRKEVASHTRLPTEELREVLEQMGKQRPAQGWEFMLNTDNEFLKEHQEECTQQIIAWKHKYKEISAALHLNEEFSDSDWSEKNFPGLFPGSCRKTASSRRRVYSQTCGSGSESDRPKPKGRLRTKSQCSLDVSDLEIIKTEKISPKKSRTFLNKPDGRLTTSYNDGAKHKRTTQLDSKMKSPYKSPSKKISDHSDGTKKSNLGNSVSDENLKQISREIIVTEEACIRNEVSSDTKPKVCNLEIMEIDDLEDLNDGTCVESTKVDEDIKPNIKHIQLSSTDTTESIVVPEPDKEHFETDSELEEDIVRKGKRKKRTVAIISDEDDSSNEVGIELDKGSIDIDMYVEDAIKSVNEVEVQPGPIECNENSDEIFVPPMLANGPGQDINEEPSRPPSDIFLKELKKFCKETISSNCINLMELKEVLLLRQQEPGNILCTGVPDELLLSCLKDSGAMEIPVKWNEPNDIPLERKRIFIYRHLGENTDKWRSIVIDLFKKYQSLRRKDIYDAFNKTLSDTPSSHSYTKLLSEFCQNHHGQWYLNGTFLTLKRYSAS